MLHTHSHTRTRTRTTPHHTTHSHIPLECQDAAKGTDTWDVGYRNHLANGRVASEPEILLVDRSDEYIRLRLINGGDTTNYHVDLGILRGTLIATDGQPCVPVQSDTFWVAVAQRLDIVRTI